MKQRLAKPSKVVDLSGIAALKGIKVEGAKVTIGALTRHHDVATSAEVAKAIPALAKLAGGIGDPAVRNRGTIGGSLANNDPSADYPAGVLGSGASITTNAREIAADEFFQGMFTTALEPGEIITEVRFPVPTGANYQKFVQPASRFALTGVFVARFPDGVRVAVTGASEGGVYRWVQAEDALSADFRPEAVAGLSVAADGMIGDLHGTPAYRANLVKVLTRRAVAAA
jgi:carbon-monoxide dehydrogenase medium subunit